MEELALKVAWTTFDPADGGNYMDPGPEVGLSVMICVIVCTYLLPDLPVWGGGCDLCYRVFNPLTLDMDMKLALASGT